MPRFPGSEAEILALLPELVARLSNNVAVYPAPPIIVMDLGLAIGIYASANNTAIAAKANPATP